MLGFCGGQYWITRALLANHPEVHSLEYLDFTDIHHFFGSVRHLRHKEKVGSRNSILLERNFFPALELSDFDNFHLLF